MYLVDLDMRQGKLIIAFVFGSCLYLKFKCESVQADWLQLAIIISEHIKLNSDL